ncbi:quinone-dependent dihydroorotate dehydrogenase [Tenacibaculum finnmarkense genomovar finnmarkense]|uniref:quinone-dependent dihydroorotate dehydrogenase n=1 Tax=Tenacibaculum finnmarkense TaxID=2781243 RepID=UPI001E59D044|nr:quinone-dependent dihydroorotate dehydrogenase [Tenacibaculum finnmarkense]MCD8417614.1 quinone-dependent dihydroorotate dehydrogenase [Tenacibaculum finnmarkense genomovar finnmarkense]MCG8185948.1 quinone-dependent dihydroorotate dehydrogenase [Tenacibaculum finnmarkense genomovar finnmarkense]MCG8202552.1 quinone-dependent dihydroorotate dehydrogenase [Tenacibaculum finnmarkense genomovar finnmarkense]MCG8209789.1 quinone-dependent dihydroorotate dehydrogenase [Tenacibaculum finnmarkense 
MYKQLIRPILFIFDPEKIHYFTFSVVKTVSKIPFVSSIFRSIYQVNDKKLERNLFGLTFKNPVGLAAGFDKNAVLYNELANFGFGFVEIGTVTPKGQTGNPKKRLFRLKDDQGIINRMGFNNEGLEVAIEQLKKNKGKIIIGGNIGKNTDTTPENYTQDYVTCFKGLHPYVDYFVLNVSCPNVGSHAKLDDVSYLKELITEVQALNNKEVKQKPILLKIAPDLNNQQLDEIIELVAQTKIDGVIASNTSVNRANLKASKERLTEIGNGGVSGQPVKDRSTKVIKYLADNSNKSFPIIGVGGIHSEKDALEKIDAGADLVQIYTGFIYEGPSLVKRINKAILNR